MTSYDCLPLFLESRSIYNAAFKKTTRLAFGVDNMLTYSDMLVQEIRLSPQLALAPLSALNSPLE